MEAKHVGECTCRVCTDHRRWITALKPQTEEAKKAFDEMCTNLEAYSTDAVYYRMKLEGTWNTPTDSAGEQS